MCGIIGYTGNKKDATSILISGLKKLEYRGYDSAGIAINLNGKIFNFKSTGKISELEKLLEVKGTQINLESSTGIGHTRWATHGVPNEINAHPHKCGSVTLVHNGIIENYSEIKEELAEEGITFKSQTDTEVACAYVNYIYEQFKGSENSKITTLIKSCSYFKGSFAFGIIFDDEPDVIYATRKDSPLLIGLSDDGNFIASDMSAILEYTKKYILIEENEYAKIEKNKVTIFNDEINAVQKKIKIADWDVTGYQKNGYEHFMLKEIFEQPKVIKQIFDRYLQNTSYSLNVDISKFKKINIVACGSAMHAGLVGKHLFETYAEIDTTVDVASEYRYKKLLIDSSTLVIIISQSGETADTLASLRIAKKMGATTLSIVNVVGSTIARESDNVIYTFAGPEIAVATTKGYASQVAILSTLALNLGVQKKIISNELLEKIYIDFEEVYEKIIKVSKLDDVYNNVAESIYTREDIFYIGRGIDSSICMEAALKLKEISYIHCEAYAAGELKHGTISLIDLGTPVVSIATDSNVFEKMVSNIKETKARGSFVVLITTENLFAEHLSGDKSFDKFYDQIVILPDSTEFTTPLILAPAIQLIAYKVAKLRNCDIDKPKNLAKSVTVE